ncbi:MAG: hypothetical protein KGZ81_13815 [Flavobacteriales bacterium]|nr:hypothetical protein [Flavobacteriales bacterium]
MAITAKDLEFVGVQHNEIVDKTYYALYDGEISEKESQIFVSDFLINTLLNLPDYTKESNLLGAMYASQNVLLGKAEFRTLYEGVPDKILTRKEKEYLDKLYSIVDKYNDNLERIISEIKNLEDEISKHTEFDEKQLITLFSATNLGKFSLEYWVRNEEKWALLSQKSAGRHAKDIVKGDIAGGVGGAVGAWVVNVIPGAGQVAYGSAIIGGAVGTSVTVAVVKVLDWLW